MPTYEYKCETCAERLEVYQSMTAEPLSVCEKCGGSLRKLISGGGGFFVKGSAKSSGKSSSAGCGKPVCGGCSACK